MTHFDAFIATRPTNQPHRAVGFPYAVALLPRGVTAPDLGAAGQVSVGWFTEPDSGPPTVTDPDFQGFLRIGIPIVVHGRRARDVRPLLQQRELLGRCGYRVEELPVFSTVPFKNSDAGKTETPAETEAPPVIDDSGYWASVMADAAADRARAAQRKGSAGDGAAGNHRHAGGEKEVSEARAGSGTAITMSRNGA